MGILARMHVERKFSRNAFGERLQAIMRIELKQHDVSATFIAFYTVTALFVSLFSLLLWLSYLTKVKS